MTLYFHNPGQIDPIAISTMGLHFKETNSPIGFFGTGLKYAIATLLRNGGAIELRAKGQVQAKFTYRPQSFRGTTANIVYMNDTPLGFTTALGKTWQLWMAYRELYSNALDEGGNVSTTATASDTEFVVEGLDEIHEERSIYFIQPEEIPLVSSAHCDIYPGSATCFFYKTINVGGAISTEKPLPFRANIKAQLDLTEDRTIKWLFQPNEHIAEAIQGCNNLMVIDQALLTPGGKDNIDWKFYFPTSDLFKSRLKRHYLDGKVLSGSAIALLKHADLDLVMKPAELTAEEAAMLQRALDWLFARDCSFDCEIRVTKELSGSIWACVMNGKVYLKHELFQTSLFQLVAALYEEWTHMTTGHSDESRALQTHLFNKVIELMDQQDELGQGSAKPALIDDHN